MQNIFFTVLLLFSTFIDVANAGVDEKIEQNTQLIGTKQKQENASKNMQMDVKKENAGKKTYDRFCIVCHRDGLLGAPKFHDEQAWKKRLSDKSMSDLVASVIKGLNAMPAKGTCYECNEEDIKSAVEYMLPNHD